jgi:transcription factor SFP1
VKLDSHETTPPPLSHSPRESTAASTPISTPVQQPASPHFGRIKPDAGTNSFYSWHRKPHELVVSQLPDTELLFEDTGDCSFSLFPDSPQQHSVVHNMAQTASPLDIQTPTRYGSNSPPNQTSNLTSALREAEANRDTSSTPNQLNANGLDFQRPSMGERNPSISMLGSSFYGSGAQPMKDRPRRPSNNNMGSFVGGMSWGGVSVGSWIRDE